MVAEYSLLKVRCRLVLWGVGVVAAVAAGGCAGQLSGPQAPPTEMRKSIALADSQPRLLLAGPARLLHVQVEKRKGAVTLYRAPRLLGTDADCEVTSGFEGASIAPADAAFDVGTNEVVCARVDRKARLSWHAMAKRDIFVPGQTLHQASLP